MFLGFQATRAEATIDNVTHAVLPCAVCLHLLILAFTMV